MFLYLLLLFTLVPFVELALLLWMADAVGWVHTLLLVLGTGVLGAALARWQGVRTAFRIQQEMASGKVPGDALVDGLLILVAGAVLLTPGVLTDACGFALLIPPVRQSFKRALKRWFERRVQVEAVRFTDGWSTVSPNSPPHVRGERIIDVEVVDPPKGDEE